MKRQKNGKWSTFTAPKMLFVRVTEEHPNKKAKFWLWKCAAPGQQFAVVIDVKGKPEVFTAVDEAQEYARANDRKAAWALGEEGKQLNRSTIDCMYFISGLMPPAPPRQAARRNSAA